MLNTTGKTIVSINTGSAHTLVLMTDGTVWSTGSNAWGQLGIGDNTNLYLTGDNTTSLNTIVQVPLPIGKTASSIYCGIMFSLVLMTDGTVWSTGANYYGQLGTGDTTGRDILTPMLNGTDVKPFYTFVLIIIPPSPAISSYSCFPANTPIQTNQGTIMIDQINPEIHTIRNKKIVAVVQTLSQDKQLVCIKKHALGNNVPSEQINISKNHKILYKGNMVKAKDLVGQIEDITLVKYTGEILYNILMDEHDKMVINNLIVETMHPEHRLSKLYNVFHIDKMTIDEQMVVIAELNKIVRDENKPKLLKR